MHSPESANIPRHRNRHILVNFVLAALLVKAVAACASPPDTELSSSDATKGALFSAPEGIAAHPRWILVGNTAFHYEGSNPSWGRGFITIIGRNDHRVVSTINSSQPNPREVTIAGDKAYVVNAGTFIVGPNGLATVTSGGGIDIIDLSTNKPPTTILANIPLPPSTDDRRIGGFGRLAVSPDGRWGYLGSGTRGDVFKVDLERQELVRGPNNPIVLFATPKGSNGLTTVKRMDNDLVVLNYNTDELCISADWNGDLERRRCQSAGVNAELLEGPIDAARTPDGALLVLMTIANAVYRVDTSTNPFTVQHRFAATGLASNRIFVRDEYAYIVNSMSNNIQRITVADGSTRLPFAVLPVASNPFDMVITDSSVGTFGWVTLLAQDDVAVIDFDTAEIIDLIGTAQNNFDNSDASIPLDAGDANAPDAAPMLADSGPTDTFVDATPADPDAHSCSDAGPIIGISQIAAIHYGGGAGLGQANLPHAIQDGPTGGPDGSGSVTGVLSLGSGGEIVVDFGHFEIVDGPGPDFIVFENPFLIAPFTPFAEPGVVAVSDDPSLENFVEFPCALDEPDGDPSAELWPYPGCAGVRPVLANVQTNCIPPTDPVRAGGDAFDLATLGVEHARYVRVRDGGISNLGEETRGFDLDAIVLINFRQR